MTLRSFFSRIISLAAAAALFVGGSALAQTVSNVDAQQRTDGSGLVDITYDLSGASGGATVTVVISADNGATWTVVPRDEHLSGDIGEGVTDGARSIVWDAKADRPEVYWPQARVEVIAAGDPAPTPTATTTSTPSPTPTPTATPTTSPAELTIMLPGGVPLELVLIESGTFVMGSPPDERSRDEDEGPLTMVTLTEDFYMGKYEVTVGQFLAYLNATGDETGVDFVWGPVERDGSGGYQLSGAPFGKSLDQPMFEVSWNGAEAFAEWVSQLSGRTVGLPTEAQWEYAARAGTTTRFFFGDSLSVGDSCEDDGVRSQYMVYCGNDPGYTAEVGTKLPNPWGLYDMHGNVWEWCADWYADSLPGGSVTDPISPARPSIRVLRGGRWDSGARGCRSAVRIIINPLITRYGGGFRVASVR